MDYRPLKKRLLGSSLFKDSAWALIGNVLGKGLALLASILVARFLGKELFGMYGLIRTTLLSIAVFSTFGLGYTATKHIAEYLQTSKERIGELILIMMRMTLLTSSLFAVLLFAFSHRVASFLEAPDLYTAFRYLAVIIIFNSITTTQIGILSGFKKFKPLARINLVNGIVTFVLSVVLTYYYSLDGALAALLVSQAFNCLQNYLEVRRSTQPLGAQQNGIRMTREIAAYSLPVALDEMVKSLMSTVLFVILLKFSNYGQLGLYNAAAQWASVVLFIPGAIRNVILSHIASRLNDKRAQLKVVWRMVLVNFTSTSIPFVVVFVFSGFITRMYGETFTGLRNVLNVYMFSTLFTSTSSVLAQYFLSVNRVWLTFWCRIMCYSLTVLCAVLLLTTAAVYNSALYLSVANVIAQAVFLLVLVLLYRHYTKNIV